MKKLIIAFGLVALSFCFMSTLDGQGIPANIRAIEQTKIMGDELKLTAAQSANIYNINMYIDEKFDKIKKDNYLNTAVMQSSIKQLDIEKEGLVEKVLTYRQFAQYLKDEQKGIFVSGEGQLSTKN